MNRYKFRGKDIDQNTWRYGSLVSCIEYGDNGLSGNDFKYTQTKLYYIIDEMNQQWIVYPNTIGQFTGMKDRNHNDIYEMDIVEYENSIGYILWCPVQLEYVIVDKIENLELKLGRYFTAEIEITSDMIDNPNMCNVRGD